MAGAGIKEIDVHGMTAETAVKAVLKAVEKADASVYRIRVIHGYHGGTRIRSAIREEFEYFQVSPRVKRVTMGDNEGITDLILREY